MYLSPNILDWHYYSENASGSDFEEEQRILHRAHDIWRHANELLSSDSNEFSCADAMCTLKRAVNHRLQTLSKEYCFNSLPFDGQKKVLEKFQHYGIIRPTLIKELFHIRNEIEHKDAVPPTLNQCRNYVDVVWYFLKSTDSLLFTKINDVFFESDDGEQNLRFDLSFADSWRIKIIGAVSEEYFVSPDLKGAIVVKEILDFPYGTKPPVYGEWLPTDDQLVEFARIYFGLSGYWWGDHVQPGSQEGLRE